MTLRRPPPSPRRVTGVASSRLSFERRPSSHGAFPLSFVQQRMWVIDQLDPGNPVYTVPLAMRVRGALDVDALTRALNELVVRHETLRTKIAVVDAQAVQVVEAPVRQKLTIVDLEHIDPARREAEAIARATAEVRRPFRLDQAPLLRVLLLRLSPVEHVLVVALHHIISDDWSLGVLLREVAVLYQAFTGGPALAARAFADPVRGLRGLAATAPAGGDPAEASRLLAAADAKYSASRIAGRSSPINCWTPGWR